MSGSGTASPFRVAVTIDAEHPDRPTEPGVTSRILDALATAGVPATFFVQGRWAEAEPAVARRIAADGHLVGNHSHHHARLTLLTGAGIARDARAAEAAIRPRPAPTRGRGSAARSAPARGPRASSTASPRSATSTSAGTWTPTTGRGRRPGSCAGGSSAAHSRPATGPSCCSTAGRPGTAVALPGILADLVAAGARFVTLEGLDDVPGRRSRAVSVA